MVWSLAAFLLIWWAVASTIDNPQAVAGPVQTWISFVSLFSNHLLTAKLAFAVQTTLVAIFLGFSLSVVVGVPLGVVMGRYVVADLFFEPWVNSWYSIPAIAFVPLTMNWTGITWVSAMLTAFLVAVFSITINVYSGVKNCSKSLVETGLAYGASQSQIMYKIILPASMPNIVVGLRLGICRAIEGVIIAEMLFAVVGLGGMIDASADKLQLALSYSLIGVLAIISIALSEGMKFGGRRALGWNESRGIVRE